MEAIKVEEIGLEDRVRISIAVKWKLIDKYHQIIQILESDKVYKVTGAGLDIKRYQRKIEKVRVDIEVLKWTGFRG